MYVLVNLHWQAPGTLDSVNLLTKKKCPRAAASQAGPRAQAWRLVVAARGRLCHRRPRSLPRRVQPRRLLERPLASAETGGCWGALVYITIIRARRRLACRLVRPRVRLYDGECDFSKPARGPSDLPGWLLTVCSLERAMNFSVAGVCTSLWPRLVLLVAYASLIWNTANGCKWIFHGTDGLRGKGGRPGLHALACIRLRHTRGSLRPARYKQRPFVLSNHGAAGAPLVVACGSRWDVLLLAPRGTCDSQR